MKLTPPWIEFPELLRTSKPSKQAVELLEWWFRALASFSLDGSSNTSGSIPPRGWEEIYERVAYFREIMIRMPGPMWVFELTAKMWQATTLK